MTKAEEVIDALVAFNFGDAVQHDDWSDICVATVLRWYDPWHHLVEIYEHGCYMQHLWSTRGMRHVII